MLKNTRGLELAISTIAIIAIVLLVIIIVVGFFLGGFGNLSSGIWNIGAQAESGSAGLQVEFGCKGNVRDSVCSQHTSSSTCTGDEIAQVFCTWGLKDVSTTAETCNRNDKNCGETTLNSMSECNKVAGCYWSIK